MAEGIAAGDKCVNILNEKDLEERRAVLRGAGIDVAAAESSGQLELLVWERPTLSVAALTSIACSINSKNGPPKAGMAFA